MRRILPSILVLSICLFFANLQILARKPQSKISHRLEELSKSNDSISYKVWVYFTDRGGADLKDQDEFLASVQVSKRALNRRRNRSRGPIFDKKDLPVSKKYIASIRELGCRVRYPSRYLNAVSVLATSQQIRQISQLDFVKKIERVYSLHRKKESFEKLSTRPATRIPFADDETFSDQSFYGPSFKQLDLINVIPLHGGGVHGEGVLIAMLDTGFDLSHVAFSKIDVIAQWDFVNNDSITKNQPGDPPGQHDHGTYTLSAIGGYAPGNLIGPAWGASFALAKTEQIDREVQIEEDDWVRGIEWAESLGADVVSSSLGYFNWYTYADMDGNTAVATIAADIAASKGVTVVTAAGNEGPPWPGIIAPSDGDSVIAVGAVDSFGVVASFSSRGPSYDGRIKPDLAAMGVSVVSAAAWDSTGFVRVNGTSLSTPLLAGACALLLQMHPYWTPMDVLEALRNAASRSSSPDNDYGWGIINAYASALNGSTGVEDITFDFSLSQSYPNPFNPSYSGITRIDFTIGGKPVAPGTPPIEAWDAYMDISLDIFDVAGRKVKSLADDFLGPGKHFRQWDGKDDRGSPVASGVYFYQLRAGGRAISRKLVVINR